MSTDSPATGEPRPEPIRFRFRIVHLLYGTALIGASLATFGLGGIFPAGVFLLGWGGIFLSKSRVEAFVVVVMIAVSGCCLCVPGGLRGVSGGAGRRMVCSNNLKQIALALHNYHDTYKTLPPAMIPDADGKPMHSWRVLILPFIEEQSLYDKYDFNEPWDGPNNSQFADSMPRVYGCPSQPRSNCASYVAVTGEHTMWTGDERGIRFQDVVDGTANTLLVLEAEPRQVNWMEPNDITDEEALQLLNSRDPKLLESGHKHEDFFHERWTGRNVALADGSVWFLLAGISQKDARAMLLRDDGVEVDVDDLNSEFKPVTRLRLGNSFRLVLFIVIVLLPLPRVWRKRVASKEAG